MIEAVTKMLLSQVAFLVEEVKEHLRDSSTFSNNLRWGKLVDFASVCFVEALRARSVLLVELEPLLVRLIPCFLNGSSVLSETKSSKVGRLVLIRPAVSLSHIAFPIADGDWYCLNESFVWIEARLEELVRLISNCALNEDDELEFVEFQLFGIDATDSGFFMTLVSLATLSAFQSEAFNVRPFLSSEEGQERMRWFMLSVVVGVMAERVLLLMNLIGKL